MGIEAVTLASLKTVSNVLEWTTFSQTARPSAEKTKHDIYILKNIQTTTKIHN
jgi:hypothetical protein